jgi:integrase
LAVETGLRSNELRSLTRASFALDGPEPSVTVAAAYSKRRRDDTLPVRPGTASELRGFLAGKLPTAAAFAMPEASDVAKMLRADLAAAGIAYRSEAGRVADFHGLRHTFISNLARGGVHPKLAQQLARHSTITLTMDRYSHTLLGDLRGALAALPDLSGPAREAARATGTDNIRADVSDGLPSSLPETRARTRQTVHNLTRPAGNRDAQET